MLALVVACVVPRTATAGRTFYGWLYGPEVMPERGVELQTWVAEENDKYGTHGKESSIWWGPLVGVSDQLELSLPLEAVWAVADGAAPSFTFKRFGIEAHYRLVSQDPVEAPALAPLVRVAIKRDVTQRNDVRVEAGLVTAYEAGSVQVVADLGFVGELVPNRVHTEVHPALGVSVRVDGELRLGAEAYSERSGRMTTAIAR